MYVNYIIIPEEPM